MDEAIQMLTDCESHESKMSEWEQRFIQSLSEKIDRGLTDKQLEKLERIWEKVTG